MGKAAKMHIMAGAIFTVSLILDIITKKLVADHIGLHERIDVLGSFVQLTLLYNRGGLFGIMQGYQHFFLTVSVVVFTLLIVYYIYEKGKTPLFCNAMGLIMSGAIGNILDRLLGKPGVVDFVYIGSDEFYRWPAFNVADAVIVIGAGLLLIFYYHEEKKRKAPAKSS
jgi:signal peptidase II